MSHNTHGQTSPLIFSLSNKDSSSRPRRLAIDLPKHRLQPLPASVRQRVYPVTRPLDVLPILPLLHKRHFVPSLHI